MLTTLKKAPIGLKVILMSFLIFAITGLSFLGLKTQFNGLLLKNKNHLQIIDASRFDLFEKNQNDHLQIEEKDILRIKLKVLQEQREQHMNLMNMIYQDYYALLTLFPFLSGLTGLFAFLLMQNGWNNSKIYIKVAFANLALLSAITGVFPEVYQQESNISNYTKMYTQYSRIQKDVLNYNLTAPYLNKDSISFDHFLIQLNESEKELINFHLGFQQKEISKETFELN